jgi:glucose-1-phosphate thymidylyltransferase
MRAIIPVAGIGSRLRPHTYTIPKVLLNVAGKPIIGHILDKIISDGIEKVTIIVGYLGEKIQDYVTDNYSIDVDFIYQGERKGLAHSIYLAEGSIQNESLLIILGDTIFDVDLTKVIRNKYCSIGVKEVDDPRRFGVAVMEGGFIKKLVEKPENPISNLALVGLYYINDPITLKECVLEIISKEIKTKGEFQLTDSLQLMIEKGVKMTTFPVEGWYDCGKPETLLATNRHLLDKNNITKSYNNDVVIIPPVYISPNCKISKSVIGPYATISDGVEISEAIIKNSIIGDDSRVQKTLLEDSIVGNNAILKGSFNKINAGDSTEIEYL